MVMIGLKKLIFALCKIKLRKIGHISKKLKMIAEGANGPTTPEADAVIKKRNIFCYSGLFMQRWWSNV